MPLQPLTWDELQTQVVEEEATYTVIHGKIYDLSPDFMSWHPGGAVAATQIGRDGTAVFDAFHDPNTQELLSNFYVGDVDSSAVKNNGRDLAYDISQIQQLIGEKGWWHASKPYYCWKFLSTSSFALTSLWILREYAETSILLLLLAACLMALFFQQGGWLCHDFLHHQVFTQRRYNHIFGFVTACIWQGFSPNWWRNKHNTHHAVPNIHAEDPDIDTMPFLAWSEDALELFTEYSDDTMARLWISHQPVLLFPLFMFARLSWSAQSILYPLHSNTKASTAVIDTIGLAVHFVWQFVLPLQWLSPTRALVFFALSQGLGGVLLAAVFVLNHSGRPQFNGNAVQSKGFYELQILTARNVNSTPFLDWITGGLNYQIEHHVFPTLPRHNYHLVSPYLQEVCAKHHIHYHKTTFSQGLLEVVNRLRRVGQLAAKGVDKKTQSEIAPSVSPLVRRVVSPLPSSCIAK